LESPRAVGGNAKTRDGSLPALGSGEQGRLADDYHVYGFDWGKDELRFYVDGVLVRSVENTHWHQPLYLIFDSETMPEWFGMPDDKDLPSTFSVEYLRAWKKK
jgi:beta-glucanase (GH16 family)